MDYIFFAVNALAVGLSVLLIIDRFRPDNRAPIKLVHYLVSLGSTAIYYSLDSAFFSKYLGLYLLANLLPIIVLIVAASLAFIRGTTTGK
ncbi:MAG: hypothetical protein PHC86_05870 [Eubacteriales bacterium]|nr:hypothetical protein [Eubacteriales bacterium]